MRFAPYLELTGTPHIVVDGAPQSGTILSLSHWPGARTPEALRRDLSAQIAFAYLKAPEFHVNVECVSNNHFDEDGLMSVFALTSSGEALKRQARVVEVASAGDFQVCQSLTGARAAFTLKAFADSVRSPLPREIFSLPYPEQAARLYEELLPRVPEILDHPDRFQALWQDEEMKVQRTLKAIQQGKIQIHEDLPNDLAVVHVAEGLDPHPGPIYTATQCCRVLWISPEHQRLEFRYESWVQLVSRKPAGRVDLGALASQLSAIDQTQWAADDVEEITPVLSPTAGESSSLTPRQIVEIVREYLHHAPPAWDPYVHHRA